KGKGAYEKLSTEAVRVIGGRGALGGDFYLAVEGFLREHDADVSLADEIIANSSQGNQLRYALVENVVAHAVRAAGYDSVIGYSKTKAGLRVSEVFDVREVMNPSPEGDYEVHSMFTGRSFNQNTPFASPRGQISLAQGRA